MNEGLRQRVVGALVLVALGVVFLPMLLDLGGSYEVDIASRVPPPPIIEPVVVAPAKIPENTPVPKKQRFTLEREDEGDIQASAPTAEPRLSDSGLPEAWVLQAGSFKDPANARELTERLVEAGFEAFVRTATVESGKNYRVFVGPKVLKENILADQRAIEKKFAIQSWLIKFEP